jgi:hypothetical protein
MIIREIKSIRRDERTCSMHEGGKKIVKRTGKEASKKKITLETENYMGC